MLMKCPKIKELDMNPVPRLQERAKIVDTRGVLD